MAPGASRELKEHGRSRFREVEVLREGGQHYQVLLRNQGRTGKCPYIWYLGNGDQVAESRFSVVVGVDSRLRWAEQ